MEGTTVVTIIDQNPDQPQVPALLPNWEQDWQQFRSRHTTDPFVALDVLYVLPSPLTEHLRQRLPDLFTGQELSFELELHQLCSSYGCMGVMHGRPIQYYLLASLPALSPELFSRLGRDQSGTSEKAHLAIGSASELLNAVRHRLAAYVGWLITDPRFLAERDELRARWGPLIRELGAIPPYPVQVKEGTALGHQPGGTRDVTSEFVAQLNAIYDRWELQRFATWDLPEPRGAQFSGQKLPETIPTPSTQLTFQHSPILRPPAEFSLQKMAQEIQRQSTPDHLKGWLAVQDQKAPGGLSYGRFYDILRLTYYRDTVLASRYGDRFRGKVTALDEVFADFLGSRGADSVKKLRLQADKLRRQKAQ
jgi:hypothetical protein